MQRRRPRPCSCLPRSSECLFPLTSEVACEHFLSLPLLLPSLMRGRFDSSLCLCLCLRVLLRVLCAWFVWCVCFVWCGVWRGLARRKNPPCVDSKRPRVYRHHGHMLKHMCAWCRNTRGRFERTHGGVLKPHTGGRGSSSVLLTKICPRTVITCIRGSPKKLLDLSYFQVRELIENNMSTDSSNHSLYLIKLFSFSHSEGNKLPDCSVGLSPFSTSITNDVNVSIATSLHRRLPFSGRVHHFSSPDALCLTQTTFKIKEKYIYLYI